MAIGAATDYTEVQLLKAGMGMSPSIPASWHLRISTTAIADDGTGATEFSGSGYAAQTISAWTAANFADTTAGESTEMQTTPTAPVVFPVPTAEWWPAGTTVVPYLTDEAGRVLWFWQSRTKVIDATHRLIFGDGASEGPNTGGSIAIGFSRGGGTDAGSAAAAWRKGALDILTGAASYGALPALYVAVEAHGREPSDSFWGAAADGGYSRLPFGSVGTALSVPVNGGLAGDPAVAHNLLPYQWIVGSVQSDDPAVDTPWDVNMEINLYDSASVGSGNLWFGFPAGTNLRPTHGAYFKADINSLIWELV